MGTVSAIFHNRGCNKLLACCLVALVLGPSLSAGEPENDSLVYIDSLINSRQYSEAVRALTGYMRENPDDFEQAQERIRRIIGVQGGYNRLIGELLDIITEDPGNVDQILALTRQLEAMGSSDDSQTGEFVTRIYNLARFAVNRKRLEAILAEGQALTAAGNYEGALLVYGEGLDIFREEFFTLDYGEDLEGRVREHSSLLGMYIARFRDAALTLQEEFGDPGVLPEELEAGTALFNRIEPALSSLIEIRGGIDETGRYFLEQLARIRSIDAAIGDQSFLSFASRLIYGQNGDATRNGFLHTIDSLWAYRIGTLDALVSAASATVYKSALAEARNGNYRSAETGFSKAAGYGALEGEIQELNGRYAREGRGEPDPPAGGGFLQVRYFAILLARDAELLELSLEQIAADLPEFQAGMETAESVERLRGIFNKLIAEADGKIAGLYGMDREFRSGPADDPARFPGRGGAAEIVRYTAEAAELLEKFRSRCLNTEFDWAYRRYAALNAELEQRLDRRRTELSAGNRLLEGLRQEDQALRSTWPEIPLIPDLGGESTRRYFYPREALARFNLVLPLIDGDIRQGRAVLSGYDAERREFLTDGELGPLRATTRALVAGLEDLYRQGNEGARIASDRTAQADLLREQGDRYYREAGAAVKQDDFGTARDRIRRAAECYNESLALEESAALRQDWDTRVLVLGQDINQRENELVIREVRKIVNLARNEYFEEDFEAAEKLLMQGQNRWHVTNAEENPEIGYWLSIVRGALSFRSDRVIPVTAPLFTEMGQLLSEARRVFEQGYALIRANRVQEGTALFDEARLKIRKVKIMFPMNHEAGMLELRMDQVTDPRAFSASFQRRLDEAFVGVQRQSAESFADLQNLAELNPGYPGIAGILKQAEILMGYRVAPPDPRILRRSDELTRTARTIVDNNDRDQFEAALRQLNEALSLNPNNDEAMVLKDRVQTRMGTGNAILSSADEGEYQRAVRELQQGNTLTAMSLVERLLQNPRNRNSTRVIELLRRIQAIL
ncbi:MAG: hypothetical protein LBD96_03290 [Treponema sp.]|nr:hypothetical protein [Treponema sp.]